MIIILIVNNENSKLFLNSEIFTVKAWKRKNEQNKTMRLVSHNFSLCETGTLNHKDRPQVLDKERKDERKKDI